MAASAPYAYYDLGSGSYSFRDDVIAGLAAARKALPPKYFYDARGSALFEAICDLPEYYPTRTELAMLDDAAPEIAALVAPGSAVVEYGSGSGRKTELLLRALQPLAYVAIDISGAQLRSAIAALAAMFPRVRMIAIRADYAAHPPLPQLDALQARRLVYFPGSTIGNLTIGEALAFLRHALAVVRPGGAMLVGVDLKKDRALLDAAYNDAQGVTAAFNLNLLERINRELDADFDPAAFRHHAFYDEKLGRVEMHLISTRDQQVTIGGRVFRFARGESIHTENSYKYSVDEFQALAREAGFEAKRCWVDARRLFSMHYLEAPA